MNKRILIVLIIVVVMGSLLILQNREIAKLNEKISQKMSDSEHILEDQVDTIQLEIDKHGKTLISIETKLSELENSLVKALEIESIPPKYLNEVDQDLIVTDEIPHTTFIPKFGVYSYHDEGYEYFRLEDGLHGLEYMESMVFSFGDLFERTQHLFTIEEKDEIGNMEWDDHLLGPVNCPSWILGTLYSGVYDSGKLKYENAIYQYRLDEISLEDLEKEYIIFIELKKKIVKETERIGFAD